MKSKLIFILLFLSFQMIFAQNNSIKLIARGGWNNYDLQGVGWTTYTQFGLEKVNENSFGYGISFLCQKTNQRGEFLINSFHYVPEIFISKTFEFKNVYSRISLSSGIDIAKREYYRGIYQPISPSDLNTIDKYRNTEYEYSGSMGLSIGYKIGNFVFGPNLSLRLVGYGINTEYGLIISGNIFNNKK